MNQDGVENGSGLGKQLEGWNESPGVGDLECDTSQDEKCVYGAMENVLNGWCIKSLGRESESRKRQVTSAYGIRKYKLPTRGARPE
jgi:hypothetical protein